MGANGAERKNMITIEVTEEQLDHLLEGARQHGRCSLFVQAVNGQGAILAVTNNRRRNRQAAKQEPEPERAK